MELDTEKIKKIKEALGLTWEQIAIKGGVNTKQQAWEHFNRGSIKSAEFFGRAFNFEPKDLIK
jgi:hypothetical protein